jgi:hypothetical protein
MVNKGVKMKKWIFTIGTFLLLMGCGTLNNPSIASEDPTERGLGYLAAAIVIHGVFTLLSGR